MKVVLFNAIGIKAGCKFVIEGKDFKFDLMLFLDIDKNVLTTCEIIKICLKRSAQILEVKSIHQ